MNDTTQLHMQPFPAHLSEACEWLSAAERHDANPADAPAIRALITASEVLTALTDVAPPYPRVNERRPPLPLGAVLPTVHDALDRAATGAGTDVELRLRIAKAMRLLADHDPSDGVP
ncbi:hypothetical protein [Phytoactinopolyspora mesophila]|uniref:Uncharacterized protein n=1 Tax=Phytoactinopolyspora mesophila TaxID=2650750 RepID=A0A7K3M3I3_9ACTN|nr:hypothetical protein [Phytoactinopolyspora mesophila]NDL57008.1 hypothetical protein [Phytoactinopolyspora mesophila]